MWWTHAKTPVVLILKPTCFIVQSCEPPVFCGPKGSGQLGVRSVGRLHRKPSAVPPSSWAVWLGGPGISQPGGTWSIGDVVVSMAGVLSNSWMVWRNLPWKMDDLGLPLFWETSVWPAGVKVAHLFLLGASLWRLGSKENPRSYRKTLWHYGIASLSGQNDNIYLEHY